MELLGLAAAFCMLMTFAFVANFFLELLKSAWCDFKKKEHKREPFANGQDWKMLMLYAVIISVGIWGFYRVVTDITKEEYHPVYNETCNNCGNKILDGYEITAFETYFSDATLCPHCANSKIQKIVDGKDGVCTVCGRTYDSNFSGQYGMCEDCEADRLVPCRRCEEYTIDWGSNSELVFCPRCMGKAMEDPAFQKALEKWWNS